MKRSEAITKAAEEFEKRSDAQQYKGYSYEGLAEEFLDIFEELGMLPPSTNVAIPHGYLEGVTTSEERNEWEK